jgi:hypothetical protein
MIMYVRAGHGQFEVEVFHQCEDERFHSVDKKKGNSNLISYRVMDRRLTAGDDVKMDNDLLDKSESVADTRSRATEEGEEPVDDARHICRRLGEVIPAVRTALYRWGDVVKGIGRGSDELELIGVSTPDFFRTV